MKDSAKITLLVVIKFVLGVTITAAVGYLLFCLLLYSIADMPDEEDRYVTFSDGTSLERTGGPTYIHTMNNGLYFKKGDSQFDGSIHHDNGYYEYGYIVRYAYDEKGNIAYRQLKQVQYSGQEYLYEFNQHHIISDRTVLYNCITDTETEFDSVNELYEYCRVQDIQLGAWYYPLGYTPVEENILLTSGNWTMAANARDYCIVDNGTDELFAGYSDRYFEYENYFGFHFQHREADYSFIEENTVIEFSTDEIVGKNYAGLIDVYVDKYVLVNSETDVYTVFDTKKELKHYAKQNDIKISWNKIEY